MTESKGLDILERLDFQNYMEPMRPIFRDAKAEIQRLRGLLTHPEAQGNKDLGEPAASGLEVPDFARLAKEAKWIADRMIWEREGLNKFTTGSGPPLFIPFFTWYAEVASALLQASAKHEAAPTSSQPINGESELESASNGMGLR